MVDKASSSQLSHNRHSCPCCVSMSMLHVHDACPRCLSVMHVHFAKPFCMPRCMSMMHAHRTCMLHLHIFMLYFHAEYPFGTTTSKIPRNIANLEDHNFLYVHTVCTVSLNYTMVMLLVYIQYIICRGAADDILNLYCYLRRRYIIIMHRYCICSGARGTIIKPVPTFETTVT